MSAAAPGHTHMLVTDLATPPFSPPAVRHVSSSEEEHTAHRRHKRSRSRSSSRHRSFLDCQRSHQGSRHEAHESKGDADTEHRDKRHGSSSGSLRARDVRQQHNKHRNEDSVPSESGQRDSGQHRRHSPSKHEAHRDRGHAQSARGTTSSHETVPKPARELTPTVQSGSGTTSKGPHTAATKPLCRLSFEDELDEEAADAGAVPSFSLAASTVHRFATERTIEVVNATFAAPALSLQLDLDGTLRSATDWQGGSLLRGPAGGLRQQHLGPMRFGVASARGLRPYMEDRHCLVAAYMPLSSAGQPMPDGICRSFAAVFDGHNGVKAAEHATQRLQQLLATEPALRTCTGDGPPSMDGHEEEQLTAAFKRAFHAVDKEILETAREAELRDGATALVVVRIGEVLYAAHAGDSRAVMSRQGQAYRLTEDHKPELPRERSRVEGLGGRVEFQRCWRIISEPRWDRPLSGLAVSRSFGDLDFKEPKRYVESEPDVHRLRLQPGDSFVVLASDGLWDVFTDQEAVDVVAAVLESQQGTQGRFDDALATTAAHALVDAALERRTQDNVTAVVLLLQWD